MVDGRKGGTVGFRLPSQPEFLFSEEATVHHRSWSENLTYYTGTGYLSGAPIPAGSGENGSSHRHSRRLVGYRICGAFGVVGSYALSAKHTRLYFCKKCFCFTSSKAKQLSKNHAIWRWSATLCSSFVLLGHPPPLSCSCAHLLSFL